MDVISLQSGSAGNCTFVRSGDTSLLFDAGISGSKAAARLAEFGYDIRDCDGVVISHEHYDHICGLGVIHRKFGLPIYASLRTWNATRAKPSSGSLAQPTHFDPGESFRVGSLRIETIPTPHDAVDGVCFIVENIESGQRFGILTDLGHVFAGLPKAVTSLDAILIESNYDNRMLRESPYPQRLKARISGKRGHISNDDAAVLLTSCGPHLQWACLGHLSAESNSPTTALATHRRLHEDRFPIFCASRDAAVQLPRIEEPRFALQV